MSLSLSTREGPRPMHSGPQGKSAFCVQGVDGNEQSLSQSLLCSSKLDTRLLLHTTSTWPFNTRATEQHITISGVHVHRQQRGWTCNSPFATGTGNHRLHCLPHTAITLLCRSTDDATIVMVEPTNPQPTRNKKIETNNNTE